MEEMYGAMTHRRYPTKSGTLSDKVGYSKVGYTTVGYIVVGYIVVGYINISQDPPTIKPILRIVSGERKIN